MEEERAIIPEVSKEKFFEVSSNLKEAFSSGRQDDGGDEGEGGGGGGGGGAFTFFGGDDSEGTFTKKGTENSIFESSPCES